MIKFDKSEIKILQAYREAVDERLKTFYDFTTETSQPGAAFKQAIRDEYVFRDIGVAFQPVKDPQEFRDGLTLKGDVDFLTENAIKAGFRQAARYATGSTALVFIGVKENDQWEAIRTWYEDPYGFNFSSSYNFDKPTANPVSVEPGTFLSAGEKAMNWTVPLLPVADFDKDDRGRIKDDNPVFSQSYEVMTKILKYFGFAFSGATQMGLMKNGAAVYIDPHEGDSSLPVDVMQQKFADYKKAVRNYPELQFIGDYINTDTGLWVQQTYRL